MSRPDDLAVFGRRVYRHQIEEAVVEHLQMWLPTYLRFIERDLNRAPLSLENPKSWGVSYVLDRWPEQQLPGVVVTSPGQSSPMLKSGDGRYTGIWAMRSYIVLTAGDTGGPDEPISGTPAKLAGLYCAAIGKVLADKPALTAIGGRCVQISEGYDDAPVKMRRSMAIAHVPFTVQVKEVMRGGLGPDIPYPDPELPPPAPHPYETDAITVESVPLPDTP